MACTKYKQKIRTFCEWLYSNVYRIYVYIYYTYNIFFIVHSLFHCCCCFSPFYSVFIVFSVLFCVFWKKHSWTRGKMHNIRVHVVEYVFIVYTAPGVRVHELLRETDRQRSHACKQRQWSDRIERNWHWEWKRHIWYLMCGYWVDEVLWYFSLVLIVCIFTFSFSD